MNSGLECNIEETFEKYTNLVSNEMTKCVKRALIMGAKEVQNQTKSNITASLYKRNNHPGKYNDKIEDAAMIGKIDGDFREDLSIKVHIMGNREPGSGTYRARFLEKGTKDRYHTKGLKKPRYIGKIEPIWFFKKAQMQVFPKLPQIYLTEIDKTINKINNSKV